MPSPRTVERVEDVELDAGRLFPAGEVEEDRSRGLAAEMGGAKDDGRAPAGGVGEQLPQSLRIEPGAQRETRQKQRQAAFPGGADEQGVVEPPPLLEAEREPPRQSVGAGALVITAEQGRGRRGHGMVGGGRDHRVTGDQIGAKRRGDGPGEAVRDFGGEVAAGDEGLVEGVEAAAVRDQKRDGGGGDRRVGIPRPAR